MRATAAARAGSPRVSFVGIPGGFLRIVRAVVDFHHHGFFVGDGGPMNMALGVAIETSGREHDPRPGIFVSPFQAEHELVGCMVMRLRDAGALVEPDQSNGSAGLLVAPEHLLMHAPERLFPPRN